ncbi:hypothetical protein NAC44_02725 [Allorhizobium sp. BGMRC 0089]|uniref:hypothetical protein n=1 Tax=Allorhizobium sonneratiae TaxID=2934936 RepID=UPI00203360D8|nr:hypothetical protein [Allorhizobium sonneratiae]MCM2291242.1 hypothetical protein [Allorhizobium sonneratiae]
MSEISQATGPSLVEDSVENRLKPVMIVVFTVKLLVAALLIGNLFAPSLTSAEADMPVSSAALH